MTTRTISASETKNMKPIDFTSMKPIISAPKTVDKKPTACENLNNIDKEESKSWLYKASNKASKLVYNTCYGTAYIAKEVVAVSKEKIADYKEYKAVRKEAKSDRRAENDAKAERKTAIYARALNIRRIGKERAQELKNKKKQAKNAEKARKTEIKQRALNIYRIGKERAREEKNKKRQDKRAITLERRKRLSSNLKKLSKKVGKAIIFSPVLVPAAALKISAKLTAMAAKALWKGVVKPVGKLAAKGLRNGTRALAGTKLAKNINSGLKSGKENVTKFFRNLGPDIKNSGIVQGWKAGKTQTQAKFQAISRPAGRE